MASFEVEDELQLEKKRAFLEGFQSEVHLSLAEWPLRGEGEGEMMSTLVAFKTF